MQWCVVWSSIGDRHTDEDVFRVRLGVLNCDVEVAAAIEQAGISQFVLGVIPGKGRVLRPQFVVGKSPLRVFVEGPHEGVCRRRIEIEVRLFDVLAMITFVVAESEQAFLENRILTVPQSKAETQSALAIGDSQQAVFAPAISAAAGVIVRKRLPWRRVVWVGFANRTPLTLSQIRAPAFPVGTGLSLGFCQKATGLGVAHCDS